ncbi:hypothetical protein HZS_3295 [Henneguya salminicola]|nr:hypothetical protein HZS_3295 [Henneguya salminicola]
MVFDNASDLYIPCVFGLINQAIAYIQSLTTDQDTLNQFSAYFKRRWMVRFPQVYGISQLEG